MTKMINLEKQTNTFNSEENSIIHENINSFAQR